MGSRALSHDSIFLDDLVMTDPEPTRVLSQENVHGKIKALQVLHFFILGLLFKLMVTVTLLKSSCCALSSQMKLQQQKMHLGPPPMVLPVRRPADLSSQESLPHSPPHDSGEENESQETLTKVNNPAD